MPPDSHLKHPFFKKKSLANTRDLKFKTMFIAYLTLSAPRSSLIVKLVMSQTSLGPQYWIGPG